MDGEQGIYTFVRGALADTGCRQRWGVCGLGKNHYNSVKDC